MRKWTPIDPTKAIVGVALFIAPFFKSDKLPAVRPIESDAFLETPPGWQFNGATDLISQAAGTHVLGARYIDKDGDGQIGDRDLLAVLDSGQVERLVPISAQLADSLKVESASIEAAYDLAACHHAFARVTGQRFPSGTWKKVGYATYAPKQGVKPADALRHILGRPKEYVFECGTAAVIHGYLTLLELKGDAWFNAEFPAMKIGPWKSSPEFWKHFRTYGSDKREPMGDATKQKLRAGQGAYFRTWGVTLNGYLHGWQGENVIYLGRNEKGEALFYGHPFGIMSGKQIVRELAEWRKRGEGTPSLQDTRRVPDPKLAG